MLRLIAVVLLLAACGAPEPTNSVDQCLRREIFERCLSIAAQRPTTTTYNDSAELVSECDAAASEQSVRPKEQIPSGCKYR